MRKRKKSENYVFVCLLAGIAGALVLLRLLERTRRSRCLESASGDKPAQEKQNASAVNPEKKAIPGNIPADLETTVDPTFYANQNPQTTSPGLFINGSDAL